jgi:hypothetical protein
LLKDYDFAEPMETIHIQLGAIILLSAFLVLKLRDRWRANLESQCREDKTRLNGHGFDAAEIKARVNTFRSTMDKTPKPVRNRTAHENFSMKFRDRLARLGFFRDLKERERVKAYRESSLYD